MRIALGVEYDGSAYHGYQIQTEALSVQACLQSALSEVAAESVVVQAAGRTDAGVHATHQVIAFDTTAERPLAAWVKGTNALVGSSLSVCWARQVPDEFHPRYQATARRYMYLFYESIERSPLLEGRAVRSQPLDDEAMHHASRTLLGEQDFSTFRAAACQSATAYRCIHRISVQRAGSLVILDITANAFLLHMVRNIAGSLWQIGLGRHPPEWMRELLAGLDRTLAAPTAPPQGLYLVDVRYPQLELPQGRLPGVLRSLGSLERF